jgi:hypothetical protein
MRLVLDAGALMAIDRSDRRVAGLIALGRRAGADLVTVAPVVGQVWRDGARQARLARALPMMGVLDVDRASAQAAGEVPRESGGSDVVDASSRSRPVPETRSSPVTPATSAPCSTPGR